MNSSPKKFAGKQKHSVISPEDWISSDGNLIPDMAFTFSPPYRKGVPLIELFNEYCTIFDELKFCELMIYPEFSSLGRLHFHGYVCIFDAENILDFYFTDLQLLTQYGTISITAIDDKKKWSDYVFKQRQLMEIYVGKRGLRYEISGPAPYEYVCLAYSKRKKINKIDIKDIPKVHNDLKEEFKSSLDDTYGDLDE